MVRGLNVLLSLFFSVSILNAADVLKFDITDPVGFNFEQRQSENRRWYLLTLHRADGQAPYQMDVHFPINPIARHVKALSQFAARPMFSGPHGNSFFPSVTVLADVFDRPEEGLDEFDIYFIPLRHMDVETLVRLMTFYSMGRKGPPDRSIVDYVRRDDWRQAAATVEQGESLAAEVFQHIRDRTIKDFELVHALDIVRKQCRLPGVREIILKNQDLFLGERPIAARTQWLILLQVLANGPGRLNLDELKRIALQHAEWWDGDVLKRASLLERSRFCEAANKLRECTERLWMFTPEGQAKMKEYEKGTRIR
jgi:hypothetical protein